MAHLHLTPPRSRDASEFYQGVVSLIQQRPTSSRYHSVTSSRYQRYEENDGADATAPLLSRCSPHTLLFLRRQRIFTAQTVPQDLDDNERQAQRRQLLPQIAALERAPNDAEHALRAERVCNRAQDVEGEVRAHGLEVLLAKDKPVKVIFIKPSRTAYENVAR